MEKLSMATTILCAVALAALAAAATGGEAAVVEHTFVVHEMNQTHLCNTTKIYVVNGQLPGPTIDVTDGDTVVVHVQNRLPHGLTIHWHGVRQMRSCWSDGAGFVTECPVPPGGERVYRFSVTGQVGTLWWHAHVTCLRATVAGAFVIRPRDGRYPFPTPAKDVPIIIGEWWQLDLVELDRRMHDGNFDDNPLSATINGKLGDLSNCSGRPERRRSPDTIVVATMNNVSFRQPTNASLLERYYERRTSGLYTEDLPDRPPRPYNYTDRDLIPPGPLEEALEPTFKATKLRRFRYNTSVEIIFQSTALLQSDSNPMHLHGYDFFVLAMGLGNYDPKTDPNKFNYHNPPLRNTVQVPRTGWAAVRFVTDNPGMWYLHCHFEFHIIMGMATAFIVEDGPTPATSLPPPPPEFKTCGANGLTHP